MTGWELPVAFGGLVAATVLLATRPPRGPGSIAAAPYLQAAVLACCLAWGGFVGVGALLAVVLATWGQEPPPWPFVALGLVVSAACLAWLGRPWGRRDIVSEGRDVRACEGGAS